ncbi:MAG: ACT domain-containing protein [Thermodesulfobacteriota bacterium]
MEKIIITVLGRDRPGIIAAVSQSLYGQDCNIENVSQMVLQSEFVGLFVITAPDSMALDGIQAVLARDLASLQLDVRAKILTPPEEPTGAPLSEPFVITTFGPDRKGLVARITGILARYDANVTNLKAVFQGGDDPDKNIMVYEVDLPVEADRKALYAALRDKARELGLDISIQHKNIFDTVNKI